MSSTLKTPVKTSKKINSDVFYRCPACSGIVKLSQKNYICEGCGKEWGNNARYPDFVNNDFYWGEIPCEDMKEICEHAIRNGWRDALEKKVRPVNSNIYNYVASYNRADWRVLIELDKNSTVLDLGAGWGTISFLLSEFAGKVYALESIRERVDFIDIKKTQENNNVYPVRADFNDPPFFNESFDLIVCNGVLEWVALNNFNGRPRQVQIDFLMKLYNLLKPGGTLYIGIENRFSYESLRGAIDHSGFPYTNLMPRFAADMVVRLNSLIKLKTKNFFLSKRSGYRTYTYSHIGYEKLLKDSGFSDFKIYFTIPSYNNPKILLPIDDYGMYRFYLETLRPPSRRSIKKIFRKAYTAFVGLGIQKISEHSFAIIAKK